jgi:hypothetical protein
LPELDADTVVIARGGTRARRDQQAATRQPVDRGQGFGHRNRPAHRHQRHGGRQGHLAGGFDDRGKRRGPVQPRDRENQVVVGAQHVKAQLLRRPGVPKQVVERKGMTAEVHQRQMGTELHDTSIPEGRPAFLPPGDPL